MEKESTNRILPIFLFLVLISLILILAGNLGLLRPVRRTVEMVTVASKTTVYRIWQGAQENFSYLTSWKSGAQKIAGLEKQVRELQDLTVRIKVLEEENKALRKQLEATLPPSLKFLPAKTIGETRYLTIDKGEEDGVRSGMMVISENILVGKVVLVTPKTSQILLPIDPDSKIPSRTIKTNARGLVIGEFGTKVILDKVLQGEILAEDDLVVTTGEGGYVRDLLIGKVERVEKSEVQPFQKGRIAPLLDYGKLVNVFVIK